jgi:hypothetical protein
MGVWYSISMGLKIIIPLVALFLSSVLLVSCSANGEPAVLSQEIAVTLLPDTHQVAGQSRLTVKLHGASSISFKLAPDATVTGALVDGDPARFNFIGGFMSIELPDLSGEKAVTLEIDYHCGFDDQPPQDAASGEDPTYGVDGVVSRKGVFLGPRAAWYPSPTVMPARRVVRINAPAGTEAITAGRRISRGTAGGVSRSVWEETHPVSDLSLSAGPYRIDERNVEGIPLYTYFTAANSHLSGRYLDASARYLSFYKTLFGPYPFEKFAVVENFFPTGYGFPSYTLLGSTIIRLPFIPDTSLPHELAHSWWGNGVLVDYREGNWSEGLVTYLADYLLEERKSPAAGREYRLRILFDYASLVSPDRDSPLVEFSSRMDPASRSIGYGKGVMVFHMIRKMTGDEVFFGVLREISRERLFAQTSWSDFINLFARRSGKDFKTFSKEWLSRGSGPRLSFSGVTTARNVEGWTVSGDLSQTPPFYHTPLQLELETSNGPVRQTISLERERTPFTFSVHSTPLRLLLDPDADLFRIVNRADIPPTVNRIKGSNSLIVVMTPHCWAKPETIRLLLESLGQQGALIISEAVVNPTRMAGHDLLFCGLPEGWEMAGPTNLLTVSRNSFTIDQQTFNTPHDALFMVTRHPSDEERVSALFSPLSAAAAADCALKITHYGKYSYLAFAAGENRRKGIMPSAPGVGDIIFDSGKVK